MTANSQLLHPHLKHKQKQTKQQLEQKQNHRNGDHMEAYQQGIGRGRKRGQAQRISTINGR